MLTTSITNPGDFVFEAEKVLAAAPKMEYDATRRSFIDEARIRFGNDIAGEVEDALPIGSLFSAAPRQP
jgi:hypothetical protein